LGILVAISSSISQILTKKLNNKNVHFSLTYLLSSLFSFLTSLIISIIFIIINYRNKGLQHSLFSRSFLEISSQIGFIILMAFVVIVASALSFTSYKYESSTKISMLKVSELLFAFSLQYFLLNIESNMLSVIGAISISMATFLIIILKILDSKEELKRLTIKNDLNDNNDGFNFKKLFFYKF
jgi:drug/metabolite transporter (DMT)-like permease